MIGYGNRFYAPTSLLSEPGRSLRFVYSARSRFLRRARPAWLLRDELGDVSARERRNLMFTNSRPMML